MNRWDSVASRYYQCLLYCYPLAFRSEYGLLLLDSFERTWQEEVGLGQQLLLLVHSTSDIVRSAFLERTSPRTKPSIGGISLLSIILFMVFQYAIGPLSVYIAPQYNAVVYLGVSMALCLLTVPVLAFFMGLRRFGFTMALLATILFCTVGQYGTTWLSNNLWINSKAMDSRGSSWLQPLLYP